MSIAYNWRCLCAVPKIHQCLQRSVYSGPPRTPNFTKISAGDDNLDWETKKLRNLRQRVIEISEGITREGEERIVDDEEREVRKLPHLIFTENSKKYDVPDKLMDTIGHSVPVEEVPKRKSNIDPDFIRPEVQRLLKDLTGRDMNKIYRRLQFPTKEMPHIRLLTDQQLKEQLEAADQAADEFLAMPPVMLEREPINEVMAEDPLLDGYEHCNVVFTDISEDLPPNGRLIVVREPNGKLRKASWDERDRILQTYFTKPGRTLVKPIMFSNLEAALENQLHENVMEQLVVQYDPDAAQFIEIAQQVYDHINRNKFFELLRSTRFFGGLAFYLAKHRSIDQLLVYFIDNRLLTEASNAVRLHALLKPESKTASKLADTMDETDIVETYLTNDAEAELHEKYLKSLKRSAKTS